MRVVGRAMRAMRMQIVGSVAGTAGLIGFVRVGGGRVYADEWVEVSVHARGGEVATARP